MQNSLRLQIFHQAVGDQLVVFGSLQVFSYRLEGQQKAGEIVVTVELFDFSLCTAFAMAFA